MKRSRGLAGRRPNYRTSWPGSRTLEVDEVEKINNNEPDDNRNDRPDKLRHAFVLDAEPTIPGAGGIPHLLRSKVHFADHALAIPGEDSATAHGPIQHRPTKEAKALRPIALPVVVAIFLSSGPVIVLTPQSMQR